jgi:hypothetical protein
VAAESHLELKGSMGSMLRVSNHWGVAIFGALLGSESIKNDPKISFCVGRFQTSG